MKILYSLIVLAILIGCQTKHEAINKFDATLLRIADHQDKRYSDSLYQFFNDSNPIYRREAILAFGSIQDTLSSSRIGEVLLSDTLTEIRNACAFALGQTGGTVAETYLIKALDQAENSAATILEALGKIKTFKQPLSQKQDVSHRLGNAWGAYRKVLRGAGQNELPLCYQLLQDENSDVRIGAANYFSRSSFPLDSVKSVPIEALLVKVAQSDSSVDVRMAAASALRKFKTEKTLKALESILKNERDYRVRVNAVRALQAHPIEKTFTLFTSSLKDENINVGIAASEVLKTKIGANQYSSVVEIARSTSNWRIQANLFEGALAASHNKDLAEEIARAAESSSNPYQKAALITALQQSVMSYSFIADQLFKADTAVVKSSAAAALVAINHHKDFEKGLQSKFVDLYKKAMQTGDPAVIGTVAGALSDSTLGYKKIITDTSFLYTARKKLSLPKDNEALQPLEEAISYFEGKKPAKVENEFNHPIDWNYVKTIPSAQRVVIKTSKGDITLRLLVDEAPGSVANFLALMDAHYFDHKFFHRVVPNFVIQAGCNRGDGWGSEDYSIRSEFSGRKYKTGSVGMASAGKDTEGTQWFITHSPTPHLDGRYTIFAEVETGMDVVHRIEVGDQIISVEKIQAPLK